MTLYEFNALEENKKADAVWKGTFLADREENGLAVQLYAVDSFYVELFYDPQANRVLRFRAFRSKNQLVPYLALIRLNLH